MARNFERLSNRSLVVLTLLFVGAVYAFASGCDGSNPAASEPQKPKASSSDDAQEPEDAKPVEKTSSKPVAPAADAKPEEQPLDPSVDVDKLMAARLPVGTERWLGSAV